MSGACNNDIAGLEEADCDFLALALAGPIPLSLTELLTTALAGLRFVAGLIVIVFCIDTLVNGAFKDREDVVAARNELMEFVST